MSTCLFPEEKFDIAPSAKAGMSPRIMDLFAPIGKGQRGLIVAQPKTGKTVLLKEVANAIAANHPEVYMIILLLMNDRKRLLTWLKRECRGNASTFDEPADKHVKIANIVLEKSKRLIECGDEIILLIVLRVWLELQYGSASLAKSFLVVLMQMRYTNQEILRSGS